MLTRRSFLRSAALLPAASGLLARTSFAQQGLPNTSAANAFATNTPWLEEIAQKIQDELHLPAVWLAVNTGDQIEAAVVGVKKFGDPTPATLDDQLTVASISKTMVALWIAALVEQGKLNYNTKVLDVLPELRGVCLPEHQDIVLEQLLTHTAQVARDALNIPSNLALQQYPDERIREAIDILSRPAPPDSQGRSLYSNNGVTLAATMAERAAGIPYEIAATQFYQELGLTSWGVWAMDLKDDLSIPWPHAIEGNTPVPRSPRTLQHHFTRPSGSAHCTIIDLARFGLIATDCTQMGHDLLTPETWALVSAERPNTLTTLSCFSTSNERFAFVHSGSLGTTRTYLMVLPEWQTTLALHTTGSSNTFTQYGTDLLQDAVRQRRSNPGASPCQLTITNVTTVDASGKREIVPKLSDSKVRIRVDFQVNVRGRTGDLKTVVTLGNSTRSDNRYVGLTRGNHFLLFVFDNPKVQNVQVTVALDALGTGGNTSHQADTFSSMLTLA